MWSAMCLLFSLVKELFLLILPSPIFQLIVGKGEFAFLVHPLNYEDASKLYNFTRKLPEKIANIFAIYIWPPIIVASIRNFRKLDGKEAKGWVVACPLTPKQMVKNRKIAEKKILKSIRFAQKLGVKLIGLGGFNSIITHDGLDLVGKTKAGLTTGNTYAAALILENIYKITKLLQVDLKKTVVAIVGAAGSVGSGCSKILIHEVRKLIMIDINLKVLSNLVDSLKLYNNIEWTNNIDAIKSADIVVTVTSTPGAIVTSPHLKSTAIIIDAAQPKNVSEDVIRDRRDVLSIDSGIANTPGIDCGVDLGPFKNEVYACLGEVLILTWHNRSGSYRLGKVDPFDIKEIRKMAAEAGLSLARFRNISGIISEDYVRRFKISDKIKL